MIGLFRISRWTQLLGITTDRDRYNRYHPLPYEQRLRGPTVAVIQSRDIWYNELFNR